jgi:hypothetical protein
MATTIGKIQIINQALGRIGVKPISDIDALDDIPAEQARINWELARDELSRSHQWSCLMTPAVLEPVVQTPITPTDPVPASTPWAPLTAYAVGQYVTYGNPAYLYYATIAHVSTASFVNDLTTFAWFQTDIFNPDPFGNCGIGSNYPSGWAYKYQLPEDCLLLVKLNDNDCEGYEEEFEIMGTDLYTNESRAVVKYIKAEEDTTRYDAMFVGCLVLLLASKLATILRQDGTEISTTLTQLYNVALHKARARDGGERKARRFVAADNSRFIASRYFTRTW